ncbi:hypothetical protein PoB_003177600 [Plakobranchus ocellatus]|uniref:Uncharacterized protein n=1 Tax=Plakobranchus ocellatus TaxID=259542 RepID=A0AAV4AAB3_9GAST|nr:hypothetical protein PoB_003177600 [Plakobranchus ocellatus]
MNEDISTWVCWAMPTKRCPLRKQSAALKPKEVRSVLLVESIPSQQLYLWQSMWQAVHTSRWREDSSRADLQAEKLTLKTNYAVTVASTITLNHHPYVTRGKNVYMYLHPVNVEIQAPPSDAKDLKIQSTLRGPTRTTTGTTLAVADTGCQSCLAGTFFLHQLGYWV